MLLDILGTITMALTSIMVMCLIADVIVFSIIAIKHVVKEMKK